MSGSATLDSDVLVDSLVPGVIDDLRASLHPLFGVRPYRLFTVQRTWAGETVGEGGGFTDEETELAPQPRILDWSDLKYDLTSVGLQTTGGIKATEVSLTYTYTELTGGELGGNVQWLLRLDEAHGQGQPSRYFTHAKPPTPDREKDMGWVLWLRPIQVPGCNT